MRKEKGYHNDIVQYTYPTRCPQKSGEYVPQIWRFERPGFWPKLPEVKEDIGHRQIVRNIVRMDWQY